MGDGSKKKAAKRARRLREREAARASLEQALAGLRAEFEARRERDRELISILRAKIAGLPTWAEWRRERETWRAEFEAELQRARLLVQADAARASEPAPAVTSATEAATHRVGSRALLAAALLLLSMLLFLGALGLKASWELTAAVRALAPRTAAPFALRTEPALEPDFEQLLARVAALGGDEERALEALRRLERDSETRQWSAVARELAARIDPRAHGRRALDVLGAFARRGDPALAPLVLAILRDATLDLELRAAALACVEPCGLSAALPVLERLAGELGEPLRAQALALLARRQPESASFAAAFEAALAGARDLATIAPLVALVEALLRPPLVESATAAVARAGFVERVAERLLREPFRLARPPRESATPAGVLLTERGAGSATIDLGSIWSAPAFQRALEELLARAAAERSLAHLYARVERLGLAPIDGGAPTFGVRVELSPGAALHLRDGGVLVGDATSSRYELDIRPGADGAPLAARAAREGSAWRALAFLEGAEHMRFELVARAQSP